MDLTISPFHNFRLTIWTVVLKGKMTEIDVTDEAGNSRTITSTNISWMLFTGWMFYIGSLILNLIYYLMHPSSPTMCNWGKEERIEGWTPPEEEEEGQLEQSLVH